MAEQNQRLRQAAFTAVSPNVPVSVSSYNFHASLFGVPPEFGMSGVYNNPSPVTYLPTPSAGMDNRRAAIPNKAHHAAGGSTSCPHVIDLCDSDSATATSMESECTRATVFLKVLNPHNKKQVLNMHTLRDFPCNLETVDELREEIFCCCSESEVPRDLQFDIGYFRQSKKLWLNSAPDLKEAWSLLKGGERLTFWCNGVRKEESTQKARKRASDRRIRWCVEEEESL